MFVKTFTKFGTLVALSALAFCVATFFSTSVFAAELARTSVKDVVVDSATQVTVTETQKLFWDGSATYFPAKQNSIIFTVIPPFTNQPIDFDKDVTQISMTDDNGKQLQFTKKVENGILIIEAKYYRDLVPFTSISFTLSYKTTLLTKYEGGVLEITHNALSKDFKERRKSSSGNYDESFNMTYNFRINKKLGVPESILPVSGKTQTTTDRTNISFSGANLIDSPVRISIGKTRYVKFAIETKVSQTNQTTHSLVRDLVTNTVQIALPADNVTTGQKVYYSKISPFPTKISTDKDGNIIVTIPVSASKDELIQIEGYAEINRVAFDKSALTKWKISDIPKDFDPYLLPGLPEWPVKDSELAQIAVSLKDKNGYILNSVDNAVNFVTGTLEYKTFSSASDLQRLGAKRALELKKGVCMEYSDLLLTLLRGMGIPARTVYGDGVGSLIDRSIKGIGHQWVEVWVPEKGWILIDPTWSETGYLVEGPDLDHFTWYRASVSPDEPSGFSCQTWDANSPCNQNVTIDTTPVDSIPQKETLMTQQQLQDQVKTKMPTNAISETLDSAIQYLSGSYIGRLLFNAVTMNVLFALGLYLLVLLVIRGGVRLYRLAKKRSAKKL